MTFELEQFAATKEWHVYSFGAGGQNQLIYICKTFGWTIGDFVTKMSDHYKAEITYMSTDGKPWLYYRWLEENSTGALRFQSDLRRQALLNRRS